MESILAALALVLVGTAVGSIKIVNEGNQALVERLGRYRTTLNAGVNWVIPYIDRIVWEETIREQVLDLEPYLALTKDSVSVTVDAVLYWQIFELEKTYYAIQDVENAIKNRVMATLSAEIGRRELESTVSERDTINQVLLRQLDEITEPWGVKVVRVEIKQIKPAQTVLESMELEQAAEIKKRAAISEAQGTAEYLRLIAQALDSKPNSREILHFFVNQRYVDATQRLGASNNAKVIFMDPKTLSDAFDSVLIDPTNIPTNHGGNQGRSGGGGQSGQS